MIDWILIAVLGIVLALILLLRTRFLRMLLDMVVFTFGYIIAALIIAILFGLALPPSFATWAMYGYYIMLAIILAYHIITKYGINFPSSGGSWGKPSLGW